MKFTVNNIHNRIIKNRNFYNDEAVFAHEAEKAGYIRRISHTQVEWREDGLERLREEEKAAYIEDLAKKTDVQLLSALWAFVDGFFEGNWASLTDEERFMVATVESRVRAHDSALAIKGWREEQLYKGLERINERMSKTTEPKSCDCGATFSGHGFECYDCQLATLEDEIEQEANRMEAALEIPEVDEAYLAAKLEEFEAEVAVEEDTVEEFNPNYFAEAESLLAMAGPDVWGEDDEAALEAARDEATVEEWGNDEPARPAPVTHERWHIYTKCNVHGRCYEKGQYMSKEEATAEIRRLENRQWGIAYYTERVEWDYIHEGEEIVRMFWDEHHSGLHYKIARVELLDGLKYFYGVANLGMPRPKGSIDFYPVSDEGAYWEAESDAKEDIAYWYAIQD